MGSHTLHIQNILMPFRSIPSSYRPCTPQPFIWCVPFHMKLNKQTHTRTYVHVHKHARTHTNTHKGKQAGAQAGSHTGANQTGFCTRFRSPIRRPPLGAFDSLPSPARLPCPTGMREKVRTLAAELAEQRARRADLQMVLEATHAAWEDARRREVCRGPSAARPPRPAHAADGPRCPALIAGLQPQRRVHRPLLSWCVPPETQSIINNCSSQTGGKPPEEAWVRNCYLKRPGGWFGFSVAGFCTFFYYFEACVSDVFPFFFGFPSFLRKICRSFNYLCFRSQKPQIADAAGSHKLLLGEQ